MGVDDKRLHRLSTQWIDNEMAIIVLRSILQRQKLHHTQSRMERNRLWILEKQKRAQLSLKMTNQKAGRY
uniref:Transposase n=1 Tax=Ascaris lumbricoides TaxID=6252 RepID=A0A0M3HJC7_ASCLU